MDKVNSWLCVNQFEITIEGAKMLLFEDAVCSLGVKGKISWSELSNRGFKSLCHRTPVVHPYFDVMWNLGECLVGVRVSSTSFDRGSNLRGLSPITLTFLLSPLQWAA
ncbi:hypothetical protein TNCV_1049931 [Trichonephila clavipes]|nr:hypothetical protein TNCV_1049931 [Trichonephila clavipes]